MYVLITRKIIYEYDVVFDDFFSTLAYTSQSYAESMAMRPAVPYIPCSNSSKEQTGDTIILTHFEEGNLLSETLEDEESGDESYDNSIMPPPLSKE